MSFQCPSCIQRVGCLSISLIAIILFLSFFIWTNINININSHTLHKHQEIKQQQQQLLQQQTISHHEVDETNICTPSHIQDQRLYVTSEMTTGGYNNQWNTLATLLWIGVSLNRTVILPPWVFSRHFDTVQSWDSVYDWSNVRHPDTTKTGFGVVTYTQGMRACSCRIVFTHVHQDETNNYSPATIPPKCIFTNIHNIKGWAPGHMIHMPTQTQTTHRVLAIHCMKKDPVLASVSLVPWLDVLLSRIVSVLNHDFIGFHLRLGDFGRMCAGQDPSQAKDRFPEQPNVCPRTQEVIDTVMRYCQQACVMHHHKLTHPGTTTAQASAATAAAKRCTTEQQSSYTCRVLIATNPEVADRVMTTLANVTSEYQSSHAEVSWSMPVEYVHVGGLVHSLNLTTWLHSTWIGRWEESLAAYWSMYRAGYAQPQQTARDIQLTFLEAAHRAPHLTGLELSVLEQYALAHATVFIGNTASTWSRWVYGRRVSLGLYNGWYQFHRWNECADWTVTAADQETMNQAPDTEQTYFRTPQQTTGTNNNKQDLFNL